MTEVAAHLSPATLKPGTRVRVVQGIRTGESGGRALWQATVEGEVLSCEAEPTGSWFAHGRKDRVWLLRLRIRKDDGEITALNLDDHSVVTVLRQPD